MPDNLTEARVRRKVGRYLVRKIPLEDLYYWLMDFPLTFDQWADESFRHLVYSVKRLIAEYTAGLWTEDELRGQLRPLATQVEFTTSSGRRPRERLTASASPDRVLYLARFRWTEAGLLGTASGARSVKASW